MESRVKLLGHPIHPMLIPFPLALFSTAAIFDAIYLASGNPDWARASFLIIPVGLGFGALAAIFGLIDFFAIPRNTRAKRIATMHGMGNVAMMLLFLVSFYTRLISPEAPALIASALAFVGAGLGLITGWLGGELMDRLGVGVDDGAHLNSPSSLTKLPASDIHRPRVP
jgi:uncharacterized membrane protein